MKQLISLSSLLILAGLSGCDSQPNPVSETPKTSEQTPLIGSYINPLIFNENPYPQIPAQCYTETSLGHQNACLYCHTNGLFELGVGNNNPQAGAIPLVNFQVDYGFDPYSPQAPTAAKNYWENTLYPEKLTAAVAQLNLAPERWDMQTYIQADNWQTAFNQRLGSTKDWDSGYEHSFRLLPGLNPANLPADTDGFVRSQNSEEVLFNDTQGGLTGWRAINFMPYGIFTPMTGSVSGIYIRLPIAFMQTEEGLFSLDTYQQNLDLLRDAIQNRLTNSSPTHYLGAAQNIALEAGRYPQGTELAHPLHYVDAHADGSQSKYPGMRATRVKEVRYMYKDEDYNPLDANPDSGTGDQIYGNDNQGWVDNGAGWILSGYIENANGELRPQTRQELTQCIGCHSGFHSGTKDPNFTSGTGNTVDSTWAMPRQFNSDIGWQEMDYLGMKITDGLPQSTTPEPINRHAQMGEFALLLNYTISANLYGVMPEAIEQKLATVITTENGYSDNWSALIKDSAELYKTSIEKRQQLLREYVAKGDYLNADQTLKNYLLYPTQQDALDNAALYRQIVVTQRYNFGKDVFANTPVSYYHYRDASIAEVNNAGVPYQFGDIINERSIQLDDPKRFDYTAGDGITLIDPEKPYQDGGTYLPNYVPYLQ